MTNQNKGKLTKNWGALYIELAKNLREALDDNAQMITWKPKDQIDFENVSGSLFDEFKSIFHYKLSTRISTQPCSPAEERLLVENTLKKYELFSENLAQKTVEISSTIDDVITRNLGESTLDY